MALKALILTFASYIKRCIFLVNFIFFFVVSLCGQCPDRDSLRKRIIYLKDSIKLFPKKQLPELLGYLDKMKQCPYRNDSTHIFLLRKIADAYFQQAEYLKAAQYRRQAIDILTTNAGKPSVNLKILPATYYYLSIAYDSLKNFAGKMNALDSCSTIAMRIKYMDRASLTALYTQVEYYYDIGDYQRCIDYAERCRLLAYEYADNNTGSEKIVGESFASSSLGWQIKALLNLNKFEQAEELLKNKIVEYRKAGLKDYLALAYGQLAEVQKQKSNFERALFYYSQSLKYYQEIRDSFNCKQTLKDIGYNIYFSHLDDRNKALAYYRKALKYITKDKYWIALDIIESLNIFTLIADVYVQKGLYDSAYRYFQLAFGQIKPGFNEEDILYSSPTEFREYKTIHYLSSLFIDKGDAFKHQYKANSRISTIRDAIRVYRKADQLLERIRTEQTHLESKLFWRSDSRRLYENAIEACYLSGSIDDAFYFFERSRAVLLQDQLREQRLMGEEDIMKQTQLIKKIQQLKASAGSAEEIFTNQLELDRLKQGIKERNPLYYQNFIDRNFITVKDVQQRILKDHQALVELFAGDSAVYVLVITAQKSYLQKISKTAFDNLSAAYTKYISHPDLLNIHFNDYIQLSHQLYQLIFQNANLPTGRIIISPDGKYFPFEALVTNAQPLTYFVKDHAMSYTYSARYLLMNFTSASSPSAQTFMGFAPVQFTRLPALTGSDQSLIRIKNYFSNAISFVGDKASKNNFLQEFYKHKIIQLYTHATDSGSTGEPTIYCSDSQLLLSDLLPEKKPVTSLIVLSACKTAGGKLYNGEGVFSFNRQFAALGIPSSVCNLWQVDNRSTYKLTELFYKYVADGLPLDLALQKAKKELSKNSENKLPYYWAASILVGQTNAVHTQDSSWKWLGLIILLLILGFWNERKWLKQTS
jgi:CHAT domain-containing protein